MKLLFSKLVDQEESFIRVDAACSQFIAVVIMIMWNTPQFRILQKLLDRFPLCGWLLDFILRLVTTKSTYIRFYIIYEKRRKILFAFRLSN